MQSIKLTPAQITDLVEDAFNLGKVYAADELESCGAVVPRIVPGEDPLKNWQPFLDSRGGVALHGGDAKTDLILRHLQQNLRDVFKCD